MLWGINHLAFAPFHVRLLWPLMGLIVIWTPLGVRIGSWLVERAAPLLLGRKLIAYGVVPILGAAVFWILRCRTHFLGDGWLLGELAARGIPYHGFDFISYLLPARLYALLGLETEAASFALFGWISIVAGAFYLAAAAWSARSLSQESGERIVLYAMLVLFAPVEMFMGYVECYAILMVVMLLYVVAFALHYRGRVGLWVVAGLFGLGLAFHLDALFLGPLLALAVFCPAQRAPGSLVGRLVMVLVPVLGILTVALGIYSLEGYTTARFHLEFVELRQGQRLLTPFHGDQGILSWRHWKDIANLLVLLVPVPLALLVAARPWRKAARAPTDGTQGRRVRGWPLEVMLLLVVCLWLLVLMSLIHMKLGIARDWDLFAAQMPLIVVAAFLVWSVLTGGRMGAGLVGSVVGAAFFLSVPWFWLNAGEERSVDRFRGIIGDQPRFSQAYAHEEIGKYYRKGGRIPEALEEYRIMTEIFPENARFHVVRGMLQYYEGDHDAACRAFRRGLEADSTYALALKMMARIHAERNEPKEVLFYARRLAGKREESLQSAYLHGLAAEQLGLLAEAMQAYERAVRKDPKRMDLMERVGFLALKHGDLARSERVYRTVLRHQPASVAARRGLVTVIWRLLRGNPAAWKGALARGRLQEGLKLADGLIAEGKANEETIQCREGIRAALGHP